MRTKKDFVNDTVYNVNYLIFMIYFIWGMLLSKNMDILYSLFVMPVLIGLLLYVFNKNILKIITNNGDSELLYNCLLYHLSEIVTRIVYYIVIGIGFFNLYYYFFDGNIPYSTKVLYGLLAFFRVLAVLDNATIDELKIRVERNKR